MKLFPGALQEKIGGIRELFEDEMNLKDSEGHHRPAGSKYLMGSSSAPYCISKYPTHMVVLDARIQQVLIGQVFRVCEFGQNVGKSYDLLTKTIRAIQERSKSDLINISGENFMKLGECNVSEIQRKKPSGALPTEFPSIDEKDETRQVMKDSSMWGTRVSLPAVSLENP